MKATPSSATGQVGTRSTASPNSGAGSRTRWNASLPGERYWRSLDELADTPEFRQWVANEFPAGATELSDPVTRRHFMKIMSASFVLAGVGLTGCRRPVSNILPFSKQPEGYLHGVPQYYATAMPTRGGAIPLVVKSSEGRPTKVEGNALHPDSNGSTDRFAQASVLDLYDPDRAMHFKQAGKVVEQAAALDFLAGLSKQLADKQGDGLSFLLERSASPSRARVQKQVAERLPKARWFVYEPVDGNIHREAATLAFGKPVKPYYRLDRAKRIVALDCDFLGAEDDLHRLIRDFAHGRKIESPDKARGEDLINRLYVVESLMTLTGVNADHRLRVPPSAVLPVAAALAAAVIPQSGGELAAALAVLGKADGRGCEVDFRVRERPGGARGELRRGGGAAATAGGARAGSCHERRAGQPRPDGGLSRSACAPGEEPRRLGGGVECRGSGHAGGPGREPGLYRAGGVELGGDSAQGQAGCAAGLARGRDVCGE